MEQPEPDSIASRVEPRDRGLHVARRPRRPTARERRLRCTHLEIDHLRWWRAPPPRCARLTGTLWQRKRELEGRQLVRGRVALAREACGVDRRRARRAG